MGQFQPPLKIFLFLKVRFINFFLIPVAQTYQNESAPIFYYAKSKKYCWKLFKIAVLQPPDWIQRKKKHPVVTKVVCIHRSGWASRTCWRTPSCCRGSWVWPSRPCTSTPSGCSAAGSRSAPPAAGCGSASEPAENIRWKSKIFHTSTLKSAFALIIFWAWQQRFII